MSLAIAAASEGKYRDTVVASGGDLVDRETYVPLEFVFRFRDGRRRNFFFYEELTDEGIRVAYFFPYPLVFLRNSRILRFISA